MTNKQPYSDFSLIKIVVGKYFDFMEELGGNAHLTSVIPASMIDNNRPPDNDWSYWNALPGTVTESEISKLELYFKHKLPDSYKFFLQQRHFIELHLGAYQVNFFGNIPNELLPKTRETIKDFYWNLPKRHYLPFAHLSDYGVLCFDANKEVADNDYSVVEFNHEDGYHQPELYSKNFLEMFAEFNSHLDDWIKNNREIKKVSLLPNVPRSDEGV